MFPQSNISQILCRYVAMPPLLTFALCASCLWTLDADIDKETASLLLRVDGKRSSNGRRWASRMRRYKRLCHLVKMRTLKDVIAAHGFHSILLKWNGVSTLKVKELP